jgi:hypothetical protein
MMAALGTSRMSAPAADRNVTDIPADAPPGLREIVPQATWGRRSAIQARRLGRSGSFGLSALSMQAMGCGAGRAITVRPTGQRRDQCRRGPSSYRRFR